MIWSSYKNGFMPTLKFSLIEFHVLYQHKKSLNKEYCILELHSCVRNRYSRTDQFTTYRFNDKDCMSFVLLS